MEDWAYVLEGEHILANGVDAEGFTLEDSLNEDLGIIQQDGSRACVDYELRGRGFSLVDPCEDAYSVV